MALILILTKGVPLYEFLRKEAGLPEGDVIMPVPFFNVLNGGAHSGNAMAFQEFMIAPVGASSIEAAVRMGAETYHQLEKVIVQKWGPSGKYQGPLFFVLTSRGDKML